MNSLTLDVYYGADPTLRTNKIAIFKYLSIIF